MNITKFHVFLVAGVLLASIGYLFVNKDKTDLPVTPSAAFQLSELEITNFQKQALAGNCPATYKLARYHDYVTLKFDEAIRWFRMAVKCPDVNSKLELIGLLLGDEDPAILREVDDLILEIRKTDPDAAMSIQKVVKDSRRKKN
ncbi:hypothetical protein H8L32_00680 [Undibacterium sp. CY18W]|uniref:Tetratricopeptide repeat protein n=1 Tax=Undibacterium hunanense TaxID=2762292 RepID=A0ABR6ZJ96_9BURK|nr:hypothetical protein [Undibacterium hunanense]MBC3915985.1 hypothetical protein [Undibacterium hunanense]